ncbi:MAG: PD-(D/E)XK nuclease family protein [Patescibacteria group bacterium]
MSQYYKGKRSKGLFDPKSAEPFQISRSKIEMFLRCPLCFYLDRRLGVGEPPGYPFSLNAAVDHLLKKEFDTHRAKGSAHPMMKDYGLDAVPYQHEKLDRWREVDFGRGGIHYLEPKTNFDVYGAVDDVWVNPAGELIIVDYKATSKDSEVNLDADWQKSYKNQMEVYQWLFRQNGFKVAPTGYFVYVNGRRDKAAFDAKLEFDISLLPYEGDPSWIPATLEEMKRVLMADKPPKTGADCDFCTYRQAAGEAFVKARGENKDYPQTGQVALW